MILDEFNKIVASKGYVLFDFFATWCMPCKMQTSIIEELKNKKIDNLSIYKIDVDESEDVTDLNNIVSVPTLIMYKDGEVVKRYVGVAQLDKILDWMK